MKFSHHLQSTYVVWRCAHSKWTSHIFTWHYRSHILHLHTALNKQNLLNVLELFCIHWVIGDQKWSKDNLLNSNSRDLLETPCVSLEITGSGMFGRSATEANYIDSFNVRKIMRYDSAELISCRTIGYQEKSNEAIELQTNLRRDPEKCLHFVALISLDK